MNQPVRQVGLMLARFALSAWVGAAVLFVINGVRMVTSDAFDSAGRDHVALIRFPAYYATGAALMFVTLVGLLAARGLPRLTKRRWVTLFVITSVASVVMLADYLWIYSPLADMITPPGGARPQGFRALHHASEAINTLQVGLCLTAAMIINWPVSRERQ